MSSPLLTHKKGTSIKSKLLTRASRTVQKVAVKNALIPNGTNTLVKTSELYVKTTSVGPTS